MAKRDNPAEQSPEEQSIEPSGDQPQEPESPVVRGSISLRYGYRGERTGEAWIEPGIYAADDPALMGLAQYLLDNGHAVKGQVRWEQAPE